MRSLRQEGAALFYEQTGGGEPPILLVHGWCCDHTYFAPQFEHFASRGHRVVAVDLRGHGQSNKPQQDYTIRLFADDLAWTCHRIGLEKPVVVGHSMGGIVAFDFREALRRYAANSLFIPTDDGERKRRILGSMSSTPQHVMVSAFEGLRDFDPTEATGGLAVPAVYVAADELKPRSDMSRFHELAPQILSGKTVGSGHFCQLEVPEQINAMIERFLAITLPT